MKFSRGRGKILLSGIGNKKTIEIVDGYYTEDGKYFIYKTTTKWYMMDVNSGLSYGKSENFLTKKDVEKQLTNIISKFEKVKTEQKEWYKKVVTQYKKLCREYDLTGGRK